MGEVEGKQTGWCEKRNVESRGDEVYFNEMKESR